MRAGVVLAMTAGSAHSAAISYTALRHVWTAPCRQGFFGVSANGSGSGHVYGLEMRPVAAGPDGERGSNSNHCGALLRAMTAPSVSIPVTRPFCHHTIIALPIGL